MREHHPDLGQVDIYPVGVLSDLLMLGRALRHRHAKGLRHALSLLRWRVSYLRRQAKRRNWRAVRSTFNGYLAEPVDPAVQARTRRCGTGWTRRAALRSLRRRLKAAEASR